MKGHAAYRTAGLPIGQHLVEIFHSPVINKRTHRTCEIKIVNRYIFKIFALQFTIVIFINVSFCRKCRIYSDFCNTRWFFNAFRIKLCPWEVSRAWTRALIAKLITGLKITSSRQGKLHRWQNLMFQSIWNVATWR